MGAMAGPGKMMYLRMCAHCHGLSGTGDGWDGQYLNPHPANFTSSDVQGLSDGDFFARVTYGLQDSAMPSWGEWMPVAARWHVIKYIQDAFITGMPQTSSVYDGKIAANFVTLSKQNWLDEGHVISPTQGADLYAQFCADCHGDQGQGDGPGTQGSPERRAGSLSRIAMSDAYIYWRVWDGVPNSVMPPYAALMSSGDLSEAGIWNMIAYINTLPGQGGGQ